MIRRPACVPVDKYIEGGKSVWSDPTFNVVGIENFSITRLRTPDLSASISLSCIMKYFGSRSSSAAVFPGSRVRVAENNNFWHEMALFSIIFVGNSGSDKRSWRAGEMLSMNGKCEVVPSSVLGDGRIASRMCVSQSWNDWAKSLSASSMTCHQSGWAYKKYVSTRTYEKPQMLQRKIRGPIQMIYQSSRGANEYINLTWPPAYANKTRLAPHE